MQVNPVKSNDISFPYNSKNSKKAPKKEPDMVYEPKEDTLFPPKLKAIIIIPKGDIVEVKENGTTN